MTTKQLQTLKGAPPGLLYLPDFVSRKYETSLLSQLDQLPWDTEGLVNIRGNTVDRRQLGFMYDYNSNSRKLVENDRPVPAFIQTLRRKAEDAIGLERGEIESILALLYRTGAKIGWHTDKPAFGETICNISLGAPCTMRLRKANGKGSVWSVELEPRSLVVMERDARWKWEHEVKPLVGERYSITMRTLP